MTKMFINWPMDKKIVVYSYHGILLSNKKKYIYTVTWMNLKSIMLNLKNQTQRILTVLFHLYEYKRQFNL